MDHIKLPEIMGTNSSKACIHSKKGIPELKEALREEIKGNPYISRGKKDELLASVDTMTGPKSLQSIRLEIRMARSGIML